MDNFALSPSTSADASIAEESTKTSGVPPTKLSPEVIPRHMPSSSIGEVLPGLLWVGNLMSVTKIESLVQISTERRTTRDEMHTSSASIRTIDSTSLSEKKAIVTVISILSNTNLIKFVTDALQRLRQDHLLQKEQYRLTQTDGTVEEDVIRKSIDNLDITDSKDATTNPSHDNSLEEQEDARTPMELEIRHVVVPLKDSLDSDLLSVLPDALDAIDKALDHGICLVHCAKGASRSVSVIIAYLLSRHPDKFNSFDDALRHVRIARPQAMPNARFAADLRRYEKDWKAKQHAK